MPVLMLVSIASANSIFSDDFNRTDLNPSGSPLWVGKDGTTTTGISGKIVDDPISPPNRVLTFTGTNEGGDIFASTSFAVTPGTTYTLNFDYLGDPANGLSGGNSVDLLVWPMDSLVIITGSPGPQPRSLVQAVLSISLRRPIRRSPMTMRGIRTQFSSPLTCRAGVTNLHVIVEDFRRSRGKANTTSGDAFFDDIDVSTLSAVTTKCCAFAGMRPRWALRLILRKAAGIGPAAGVRSRQGDLSQDWKKLNLAGCCAAGGFFFPGRSITRDQRAILRQLGIYARMSCSTAGRTARAASLRPYV